MFYVSTCTAKQVSSG